MKNEYQAVNDALGFPLGDAFEKAVTDYMEAHADEGGELVIAVVDLDHFLRVNEAFGREAGDRVLIETGRCLAQDLPDCAAIYRTAGDEFGILFIGIVFYD